MLHTVCCQGFAFQRCTLNTFKHHILIFQFWFIRIWISRLRSCLPSIHIHLSVILWFKSSVCLQHLVYIIFNNVVFKDPTFYLLYFFPLFIAVQAFKFRVEVCAFEMHIKLTNSPYSYKSWYPYLSAMHIMSRVLHIVVCTCTLSLSHQPPVKHDNHVFCDDWFNYAQCNIQTAHTNL